MSTSSPSAYEVPSSREPFSSVALHSELWAALAAFCIPASFLYVRVAGQQVSPSDITIWLAFAAWAWTQHRISRTTRSASASLPLSSDVTPHPGSTGRTGVSRFTSHVSRFTLRVSRLTPLDAAVAFLVAAALLSLLVARDRVAALYALRVLILQPVMLYIVVRSSGWPARKLWRVVDGFVLGGTALAAAGLIYYVLLGYGETVESMRRLLVPFYDSPNHIALYLGRVAPLAACVAVFGTDRPRRIIYGLGSVLMLVCMALTASRGAWLLGLPAAALVVAFAGPGRERKGVRIAAASTAVAAIALLPLLGALRAEGAGTPFLRVLLWRGAWNMIAAHPLLGVGLGNFHIAYPRFMLPEAWREPLVYHAHNVVLDFWSTLGLVGLAAFVWLQIAFWRTANRLTVTPQVSTRALALGLMAGMAYGLAHGLVDTFYFLPDLALATLLAMATGGRAGPTTRRTLAAARLVRSQTPNLCGIATVEEELPQGMHVGR